MYWSPVSGPSAAHAGLEADHVESPYSDAAPAGSVEFHVRCSQHRNYANDDRKLPVG